MFMALKRLVRVQYKHNCTDLEEGRKEKREANNAQARGTLSLT